MIRKRLPGLLEQFKNDGPDEECSYILPLQSIMQALIRDDLDGAKAFLDQMPAAMRADFDLSEAQANVSRLGSRESNDLLALLSALSKLCDDPSEDNIEAFARLELEKEARTCKLHINTWTDTFRPISQTIWGLASSSPEGECGVQRLDRFHCTRGSYSCEYISEKRILNPNAEPFAGIPCGDLEEGEVRYEHDGDGVYPNCEIISFF